MAFSAAGSGELNNGWMFGYQLSSGTLSQTAAFSPTPYGTGGGIWQSGAGPAAEVRGGNSYIYVGIGNGTFDLSTTNPLANDAGDTLLTLNPLNLAILDYYAPSNVLNYQPPQGKVGLCLNDEDFGSGGVMVVPSPFTYNNKSVLVNADKQSNLYIADRTHLGGFNPNTNCMNNFNNIQCITTPPKPGG